MSHYRPPRWLYDRRLKGTLIAPLGMGACRFLNVLLGMSAAAEPWYEVHWLIAAAVGIYIAGVTWFARTEAEQMISATKEIVRFLCSR